MLDSGTEYSMLDSAFTQKLKFNFWHESQQYELMRKLINRICFVFFRFPQRYHHLAKTLAELIAEWLISQ